jgi:hypothetical protein
MKDLEFEVDKPIIRCASPPFFSVLIVLLLIFFLVYRVFFTNPDVEPIELNTVKVDSLMFKVDSLEMLLSTPESYQDTINFYDTLKISIHEKANTFIDLHVDSGVLLLNRNLSRYIDGKTDTI